MREPAVLLIDEERVTIATSRILAAEYDVTATSDPARALAMVASGLRFHAILCDLGGSMAASAFHGEMAALDLLQARQIVFFTASDLTTDDRTILESQGIRVIRKPAPATVIRETISELCRRAQR